MHGQSALGLWRGRPFGDLSSEPALSADVARLEQMRLRAVQALARIDVDRGRNDRVVEQLRRILAEHRSWNLVPA